MSAVIFTSIELPDKILRFQPPLKLFAQKDIGGYLVIEDKNYGLCVFAKDIAALKQEVANEFVFMWEVYARGDAKKLTSQAKKLRQTLLYNIKEESVTCAI